jgi:hypothetical protein
MSMDCDSLTSLKLSTLFMSYSELWVKVKDASSVISSGIFGLVDRYALLTDCCAKETDGDWI